jgi:hypothetical protein
VDGDRLDDSEVSLVLRRAAELDHRPASRSPGVDLASVEEAAAEVGLSPASVRQAVAELRAGALVPDTAPRRRVLGPPTVTVVRTVPGPAPAVRDWLHDVLARQLFCLRRDHDGHSHWERRDDLAAAVRRGLDALREHRLVLRDVERLHAVVVEEPGGDGERVVVRLELDVRHVRREQTALLASGGALGAAVVAGTVMATGLDPALLVAAPLGGGIAAAGHGAGAWIYRRRVEELTLAAEGMLDRLERRAGERDPLNGRSRPAGRPSRPFRP